MKAKLIAETRIEEVEALRGLGEKQTTEIGKRKWDGAKKLGNKGADEAQKA
jgi:hypothetical protein